MKHNSKKSAGFVFGLALVQVIALAPYASAIENPDWQNKRQDNRADRKALMEENKESRQANRQEASCERITIASQNHVQKFDERKSKFGEIFGDKMTVFEDRRDDHDAKLNDSREKQDERRAEMYMKLEALAKTDAQKAAVETFKETVEKAVDNRREAINEAIDAFRKDVDTLVASKKTTVNGSVDVFQSSVKAAFEKAKTDCANGTDPKTVRETLAKSLQDARAQLQENRKSFESVNASVPALATAKKTAIEKARQDFKTTMEKARADLKAAL